MSRNARLIILCGLPGSGKTTLARTMEARLGAVRLSADEWMDAIDANVWDENRRTRIEALQWVVAQRLLDLGMTVIIEWGTWSREERDALREGARAFGAAVELHYVFAAPEVLLERTEGRGAEDPPITREQMAQWARVFEVPTGEEMALYDLGLTTEALSSPDPANGKRPGA